MSLRRAGVDPSAQEDHRVARARVVDAARDLVDTAIRARLHLILDDEGEGSEAAVIRRFEVLMLARKAAESIRMLHQGLLSLYPEVDEDVIEETRLLQSLFSERMRTGFVGLEDVDRLEALVASLDVTPRGD